MPKVSLPVVKLERSEDHLLITRSEDNDFKNEIGENENVEMQLDSSGYEMEATDDDIKKEIEDFLNAPMDIDDSQYKEAVQSMLAEKAIGNFKTTLAGQEKDQASVYNALSQCREKAEIDSTIRIKQEEACDSHSIDEYAVDTGFEDSKDSLSVISTEGDIIQSENVSNGQTVCVENAKRTSPKNNQPTQEDLQQSYSCAHCSYQSPSIGTFLRHVCKELECDICKYKTTRSIDLKKHVRTHTSDKPFICNFCDYKTTVSSHLKRHVRIHRNKPYTCKFCDYKTNKSSTLKTHVMTHTVDKSYICKFCEYKTTTSSALKVHVRTHTGDKPYIFSRMDLKVLFILLVVVVSSYAKLHDRPPPGYDRKLINRPPPPKDLIGGRRMYRSAPAPLESMHERMRRSPQHGSVVLSGSRTEGQGPAPAQQSVRGDYNHNLWRGKNGATVDANAFYQRNWGGGPRQDYGGGIRASIPFGRR